MSIFSNPGKAISSSLGGIGGAILGNMILPGIGGAILGGALGQGSQNAARGKSFVHGALKGGIFGAGYPIVSSLIPGSKKKRSNQQDNAQIVPVAPAKNAQLLANEQFSDDLKNRLYRDKMALNASNFPVYLGDTNTPMSPLTQKAQMLRAEDRSKSAPYSKKVGNFLRKEATGFSPAQSRELLNMIKRGDISERSALERLQKQFGGNYGYEANREERLKGKIGNDATRSEENTAANFKRLNDEFAEVEKNRNLEVAKSFHRAGQQKSTRRNALINQLEEFGNQEHALGNLMNRANRDSFDEEVSMPNRKIMSAYRDLENLGPEDDHPSRTEVRNKELQRIKSSYDTPHSNYPGKRVIGMQPETQLAFNLTNAISPKYKDSYHADRKAIEKNVIGNSLPDQAFRGIPGAVDPLMKNLDYLSSQQLKKQSKEIAGKHVRLGSYGSGSHKAETEKAIRELLRKVQQEREGVVTGATKAESALAARREQTALSKHRMMDLLGTEEHANLLDSNRNLSNLGWTKRANKQADENEALKAWYNQMQHSTGAIDVKGYENLAKQYDTDLNSLFGRPQTYSNNVKAFDNHKANTRNNWGHDLTSRRELEDYEEQQRRSAANGQFPNVGGNFLPSNLRNQAFAMARATPVR